MTVPGDKSISHRALAMGAGYELTNDGVIVAGSTRLVGARVDSHADHRIAMAMAMAVPGLAAEGTTVIEGWEAVAERDLEQLCGS